MKHLLFVAAIVAAASPAHAQTAAHDQTIDIKNFMLMTVTVTAGSTITWTNRDQVPHTVVAKDKSWRSAALDTGDSYSHRFDTPGTYDYFCSLHPQMVAKVVVVAKR